MSRRSFSLSSVGRKRKIEDIFTHCFYAAMSFYAHRRFMSFLVCCFCCCLFKFLLNHWERSLDGSGHVSAIQHIGGLGKTHVLFVCAVNKHLNMGKTSQVCFFVRQNEDESAWQSMQMFLLAISTKSPKYQLSLINLSLSESCLMQSEGEIPFVKNPLTRARDCWWLIRQFRIYLICYCITLASIHHSNQPIS